MTNNGDDCYFFYYSTCAKGDSCPFRHCEAAMGNETVCSLWQEGRCYRLVCKFRHMEIKKNRKEIPCYWENQPAGCQKSHCAFYHEKPRVIDGVYVPASKGLPKNEEPPHEEPTLPPPAPLPTAANPQLRGVIKAETQENVPSPTHPPVVINPADDDEDEDDQFSEEGEDYKVGADGTRLISPRKLPGGPSSGDSLNFGVSTLEEIRLRKALKASMNRTGYAVQNADSPTILRNVGEKENIRSLVRPALFTARDDPVVFEETVRLRGSMAERLGKKIFNNDPEVEAEPPLKHRLAERLGRVVDEEEMELAPQKALKPVRERLGLPVEQVVDPEPAEINSEPKKVSGQIRIKTLEEIRQEKAAKAPSLSQKDCPPASIAPAITITKNISSKPTKGTKRAITVKASSISQIKTFSEVLHAKKKRQEEEEQQQQQKALSPKKAKQPAGETPGKTRGSADTVMSSGSTPPGAELKVKTLEEIRREKAARMQAQQSQEADSSKSPASGSEDPPPKKPRLLHANKPTSPASNMTQRTAELTEKTENTEKTVKPTTTAAEPSSDSSNGVKVKTFEEIMREKRLRKQQMEEQASSTSQSEDSTESEPAQKPAAGPTLKRTVPIRARVTPPAAAPPSSTTPAPEAPIQAPKPPVSQRISLRTKAAVPVNSTTTDIPAVASTSPKQASPPRQAEADSASCSPTNSTVSPGKRKRNSPGLTPPPPKQVRGAASPGPSVEEPPIKSLGQTTEPKVRPKLNVKPSVMKPAVQVKPGQKRKAAERSAVAAIKPLNSTSTVEEEPLQELPCKQKMSPSSSSTEAQVNAAVPGSPPTLSGSGCNASPLREELQTVPVVQHSPVQTLSTVTTTVPTAAASETSVVPQSPIMKPPAQSRTRKLSVAASRAPPTTSVAAAAASSTTSSAVDDFEELMNEFTGDHMEEDMDPGMGEEDLLQELSEMIDS